MLLRGGLATAAGVGALAALSEQQAAAATAGVVGVYNPFDYGAVGDGSHDDTSAIQAALTAAGGDGGQIVLIPGGYSYKLTRTLHVYNGTTVVAYGAHLFWGATAAGSMMNDEGDIASPANYSGYTNHWDVSISGGTWDGKGVASQGFTINHGRNYVIRDVTVRNLTTYHAIDIQGMQHVRIENCRFEGYTKGSNTAIRGAIQIDTGDETGDANPCDDITIRNCYAGTSDESGGWGGLVDCHSVGSTPHSRIRVLDNVAEDVLDIAIRACSWTESIIEGNVVTDAGGHGIYAGLGETTSGSRLLIRNNIIKNPGAGGIRVDPYTHLVPPAAPVSTGSWSYVDIEGNQVYGSSSNGIYLASCLVGSICDNEVIKVQTPANYCIQAGEITAGSAFGVQSLTVKNNRMYSTVTAAVRLSGTYACQVTGNKIMGTTFTHAFSCGDAQRTIISQNDCTSSVPGDTGSGLTTSTWLTVTANCTLALAAPRGRAVPFDAYTAAPASCGDNFLDGVAPAVPMVTTAGTVVITPSAPSTPTKATVTFPDGLFTTAPIVVATAQTTLPGNEVTGVGIGSRSATSVDIWLTRTTTTQTAIAWQATGS